ncbi:MAG: mechanosensitive ion channel family protein [Candidatus Dadabacteria bacterium]|nr:mechanosensitive ion channel family protein [Candidatus Dadabacteria bacterium]
MTQAMDFGALIDAFRTAGFYEYFRPLAASAVAFVILLVAVRYLSARFRRFSRTTENTFDDAVADIISGTHTFFVLAVSVYVGSAFLAPDSARAEGILRNVFTAALVAQAVLWFEAIARHYISRRHERWGLTVTQSRVAMFFLRMVLWFLAALILLENLGIRVTPLIAGLGVGGIALALAVQNVLGELIASLSIVLDKPFVVGDFIVVGQFRGEVEKIGFKTTRVRSISGELVVFSNNQLVSDTVLNYRNLPRRRCFFTFGVVYETDAEKLGRIPAMLKDIIDRHPMTEYERVHFVEFADFSLNFEVAYYVLTSDYTTYLDARQDINLEIVSRFREEKISFAYPTQTLLAGNRVEVAVKE